MACALTAMALCGGTRLAYATCGDYLHQEASAQRHNDVPTSQLPRPVRCTGPQCQRLPLAPPSPGTPVWLLPPLERCLHERGRVAAAPNAPSLAAFPIAVDDRPVAGAPSDVDHIPRAA